MLPQQTIKYHLENGRKIANEVGEHPKFDRELRFLVPGRYLQALPVFRELTQDPQFPEILRRRWANGSTISKPQQDPQCFTIECNIPVAQLTDERFLKALLAVVKKHNVIFDGWGVAVER